MEIFAIPLKKKKLLWLSTERWKTADEKRLDVGTKRARRVVEIFTIIPQSFVKRSQNSNPMEWND